MADTISVEVVFAEPGKQSLLEVELRAGATVAEAIQESAIASRHTAFNLEDLATGVWGRPVARTHPLRDGDRVELYRELQIDPREARRQLALAGRTMREGED